VGKGFGFVECLVVLKTVVEVVDELVEQMPGCGAVAVVVFLPAPVVVSGGLAVGRGGERPRSSLRWRVGCS
jgi:hypothetical protein